MDDNSKFLLFITNQGISKTCRTTSEAMVAAAEAYTPGKFQDTIRRASLKVLK